MEPRRQLAEREAGTRGQRIETDERRERGVRHVALDADAAERVRPVEHDDGDAGARARTHGEGERPLEGVVARADVLKIDDEGVEPGEHRRRRLPRGAVEADHRESRDGIALVRDRGVILWRAPDSVLGREQSRQAHAARVGEQRRRVLEATVHRRLVAEQADGAALEAREVIAQEDIEAGQDGGHAADGSEAGDTMRAMARGPRYERLATERANRASARLDRLDARRIAALMNREDARAVRAVGRVAREIAAARRVGARTVIVTCSRARGVSANVDIAPAPGPEVLAGSTRLKAGTATKLVLNTLTT